MSRTFFSFLVLFVILIAAQVVIFNRIWLFNVALPIVFIFFIISLPYNLNNKWVLTLSFILGFTLDIFSNTLGLNAMCCTVTGGIRYVVLRLYVPREEDMTGSIPSPRSMDRVPYMKYLITMTTIYCILFFTILSFDFFNLGRLILRIVASSALTFIILLPLSNFLLPQTYSRR